MSQSADNGAPLKRSPHYGPARTHILALDKGIRNTIQNAIDRWTAKRIAFIEGLPDVTQSELDEQGLLAAPSLGLGAPASTQKQESRPGRTESAQAQRAAPSASPATTRPRL